MDVSFYFYFFPQRQCGCVHTGKNVYNTQESYCNIFHPLYPINAQVNKQSGQQHDTDKLGCQHGTSKKDCNHKTDLIGNQHGMNKTEFHCGTDRHDCHQHHDPDHCDSYSGDLDDNSDLSGQKTVKDSVMSFQCTEIQVGGKSILGAKIENVLGQEAFQAEEVTGSINREDEFEVNSWLKWPDIATSGSGKFEIMQGMEVCTAGQAKVSEV